MAESELLMLSSKQETLLAELSRICDVYKLNIIIDSKESPIFSKSPIALDIEHDEWGNYVGCGLLNIGSTNIYYFSSLCLLTHIDFSSMAIVAHNGKSDLEILRSWGINVSDNQLVHDTMLIGHSIDSSHKGYGLKDMAKRDLQIEYPSYEDIVGAHKRKSKKRPKCLQTEIGCCERITLDKQPVNLVAKYNALDCYATAKLYEHQTKDVTHTIGGYFNQTAKPVSLILTKMENRGIRVDVPYLKSLKGQLEAFKAPLEAEIKNDLGNINLNSPKQLLGALHAKKIFPKLKNKPSTDKRALASYSSEPVVKTLLQYSEIDTLLSSFVYSYLERGTEIIHPFFNQCGTRTGRLSCSNPNLLQIPRRTDNGKLVRGMFIPREGMLMGDCDFGQIESRVLAHLSEDKVLCDMFNSGIDFHTFTAERLGISRDRAKVLNLSVGYRATFKSVQAQLGGTHEEAQTQINNWWSLFPGLRRWQESLIYDAQKSGFCTTLLGRRIKVDGLTNNSSWGKEAAERQLINNIAQGSAAEIMMQAMIKIDKEVPAVGLLVQVYDELLFECEAKLMNIHMINVEQCMTSAMQLDVPLTVESGTGVNWTEAHS